MRKEVEALEDHANFGALCAHLAVFQLVEQVATLSIADQLAVDRERTPIDLLQVVDAPQEGALA